MLEDSVHVPGDSLSVRPIRSSAGQLDHLAGACVELRSVAEVRPETRTHLEPVPVVDTEIAAVEEPMDIGTQEEPVVHAMLSVLRDGADVCCLKDGADLAARDGAPALVGGENQALERLLSYARDDQPRCTSCRAGYELRQVGGLVDPAGAPKKVLQDVLEVAPASPSRRVATATDSCGPR